MVDTRVIAAKPCRRNKDKTGHSTQDSDAAWFNAAWFDAAWNVKAGSDGKRKALTLTQLISMLMKRVLSRRLLYTARNIHDSNCFTERG